MKIRGQYCIYPEFAHISYSRLILKAMEFLKPKITINQHKYTILDQIGEGAYAFVYRVKQSTGRIAFPLSTTATSSSSTREDQCFAIKKIICQLDEQLVEAKKEIAFLRKVNHPNIMKLIDCDIVHFPKKGSVTEHDEVYMLLPLYHTNVQALVSQGKGYPNSVFGVESMVLRRILMDCCRGLLAIHQAGYRHADFKPGNILLTKDHRAVLTDFGSVCPLKTIVTSRLEALRVQEEAAVATTASYRSPELFDTPSQCVIDERADVWSYGCTLYFMMYSSNPFEVGKEGLSTLAVQSAHYSLPRPSKWPDEYDHIIKGCLQVDCKDRFSMESLLTRIEGLMSLKSQPMDQQPINVDDTALDESASLQLPASDVNMPEEALEAVNEAALPITNDDEEFGDFESAPIDENKGREAMSHVQQSSEQHQVVKTVFATMLRPRGIMRQVVVKAVCLIILKDRIIIRKSIDPDSKIHEIISLKHPIRLQSAGLDVAVSSGLGPHQLIIQGSFFKLQANSSVSISPSAVRLSGLGSSQRFSSRSSDRSISDITMNDSPSSSSKTPAGFMLDPESSLTDSSLCLGFESSEILADVRGHLQQLLSSELITLDDPTKKLV
jgi:serine/threonine protein kinase